MTKRKKVKGVNMKKERAAEEETEVTRPSAEEEPVEKEPQEEAEETRELAAGIPQEEVAPAERPLLKRTILEQCMQVPSFRTRVLYHIVKKFR